MPQKDNSTLREKVALRQKALSWLSPSCVLETHGGAGKLYRACYDGLPGIVFEKDTKKADLLAGQRPTWAVYEGDCVAALGAGAGAHRVIDWLDCDPYGEPFSVLDAFFSSDRPLAEQMVLVVNDGLRQKVQLGGAWDVAVLRPAVEEFGNHLYPVYLQTAKFLVERIVATRNFAVQRWHGYYCGKNQGMTHYAALLSMNGEGT